MNIEQLEQQLREALQSAAEHAGAGPSIDAVLAQVRRARPSRRPFYVVLAAAAIIAITLTGTLITGIPVVGFKPLLLGDRSRPDAVVAPSSTPSPRPNRAPSPSPSTSAPLVLSGNPADIVSPSGHIACEFGSGAGPANTFVPSLVQCDVANATWRSANPALCPPALTIPTASLVSGRHPDASCTGAMISGGTVLAYGRTATYGDLSCTSEISGMTCRNSAGHGFTVSVQAYQPF